MPATALDFSHHAIWRIAAPMILSAVSVPLLGLVDTAVMGHLEAPMYLAAVAAGAMVFNVVFLGLNFLRMGTTGIAAQAFGANNRSAMASSLLQPLLLAFVLALILLLVRAPIVDIGLRLLAPSAEVGALLREYYVIRIWSAPAALANLVLLGWLLGMQNARGPLAMVLVVNLINIVLDLLLVVGLGLTVAGVALASVMAEYAGMVVGAALVWRTLRQQDFVWQTSYLFDLPRYRRLFSINGHLFMRSAALMFTLAFVTAQSARLGDTVLAANAILLNFLYFFSYAQDGMAHAAEALIGKAVGARSRNGVATVVRRALLWTGLFALSFMLVYALAGAGIVALLTNLPAVRAAASEYLPWLIALPAVSAWCFLYDGVYVGITRTREMMLIMVGAMALVFLPVWYGFNQYGNHALWAALLAFFLTRSVGMHIGYRRILARDDLLSRQNPS
jgi:MATE family multidrug resistance protein